MGWFSRLFGSGEEQKAPEPEFTIIEPVVPAKNEYEVALEVFEQELEDKAKSLDESRETLYDQKAKLNTKRAVLKEIETEVAEHKAELAVIEEQHMEAVAEVRTELEIRGQRLQNIIIRKEGRLNSEKNALASLERTIDMLEKSILANDIALSQKHTKLDAAKTAVAINSLNENINQTLSLCRVDVDESGLDFFLEKQKVILEETSVESTVVINTDDNVMAIPFKERVIKDIN